MTAGAARLILLLFLVFAGACTPGDSYLTNGIGAGLPPRDIENSTTLLNRYFDHLCQQAGLSGVAYAVPAPDCNQPLVDQAFWTLIVRQGMNDIDRRCDAYLEWLDNVKRSRAPVLAQINAVQTATTTIMEIVDPGSAAAMSIVGQAFSLLTQSIENYHSRLLLEIESSTINSVVLRAQHDFRVAMMSRAFTNRPDAEYVLRAYLRLCLPFAIETNINDYTTLGSRGILVDERTAINQIPIAGSVPFAPASRPVRVQRPRRIAEGARGEAERTVVGQSIATSVQAALCIRPTDGILGPKTRAYIKVFEETQYADANDRIDSQLDLEEINDLTALGPCGSGFDNFYERVNLSDGDTVAGLAETLREDDPAVPETQSLADLRPFIRERRDRLGLDNGPEGIFSDQVTKEFARRIGFGR